MNNVFSPLSVKNEILDYLNKLDYLLFNEKDLQIYLAIKLKEQGYKVYTEYRLPKDFNKSFDNDYVLWKTEKPSIDIVLEYNGQYIAIELKYKLKEIKGKLERFGQKSNKEFSLVTNQSAQNEARYDFWKDVKRLELIQEHYNILGGIALFVTNDKSYKVTNPDCEYSAFGLDNKKENGLLRWGNIQDKKLGKKEKKTKKRPNFKLIHSYVGIWEPEPLHNRDAFSNEKFHVYSVIIDNKKLFTKSAFKTALTCPRQLYYYYDSQTYANQNNDDGFLQALAEGGFQVGELAKIYNGITDETDIKSLDYITSLEETKRLFERDDVCIAEAAFRYKNCFVRVDLLKKNGNTLELIEVKAKSWDKDSSFTQKKNPNKISSDILPYLYDVAFQKWVVTNALKEQYPDTPYTVKAFLMMADKGQVATVDGMNQCFRIGKDENKRIKIEKGANAKVLKDGAHVLTAFPVDEYCDKIIRGEMEVMGYKFEDFVEKMADNYCNHKKAECKLGTQCFTCPFQTTPKDSPTLKDGYKECWKEIANFTDEDFEKPLVKDLWGAYIKRGDFIKEEKYFLKDLSFDDLKAEKIKPTVGLHHIERKLLQIGLATNNEEILRPFQPYIKDGVYIDVEGLQEEMKSWKFPLHMIDFETTAVALPFYKGLRPYEQVAFQFSHHIIRKADNEMGYTIEHAGQYLNTKKGYFPNFDFVRELKMQLEQDNGSVFRYANHENTILRSIHEQLKKSNEPDKEELLSFIDTLTHTVKEVGERDMIDLLEVVKLYFYHPIMKGSNSIKEVLPAVLNSSELLKKKYSQPIYGTEITSKNYTSDSPRIWIAYKENGEVDNPYKKLESISSLLNISEEELSQFGESLDEAVCDGGAALAAYSKLQFSDDNISEALETALLRYCELDTLAMVFIWEYFNEIVTK